MSANEHPVYRYGDFPELFWDLQRDEAVDGSNPAIIARLLEHADPAVIWKLVPAEVLLRDFEKLDLPEHTRRFWSVVVRMMREERGIAAPVETAAPPAGIQSPPRLSRSARAPELPVYRYGDFPELFWDLRREAELDRQNPVIIARVLAQGNMDAIRKIVPMDVLEREFERLEPQLPDDARRLWAKVVEVRRRRKAERGQAA